MRLRGLGPLLLAIGVAALGGCARDGDGIRGSGTIEMDEIDVASLVGGRLEVVPGVVFAGASPPDAVRASGLGNAASLRAALVGRIDLLLPDVRK